MMFRKQRKRFTDTSRSFNLTILVILAYRFCPSFTSFMIFLMKRQVKKRLMTAEQLIEAMRKARRSPIQYYNTPMKPHPRSKRLRIITQPSPSLDQQQQLADSFIRPFKFERKMPSPSSPQSNSDYIEVSYLAGGSSMGSCGSKLKQMETDATDIYEQDFESYSQSDIHQTIQELLDSIEPQLAEGQIDNYEKMLLPGPYDHQYGRLMNMSEAILNSMNQRIIRLARSQLLANGRIIEAQNQQLKSLRSLKQKALDYNYEKDLDDLTQSHRILTNSAARQIKQIQNKFSKKGYQLVQLAGRRNNTTHEVASLEHSLVESRLTSTRQSLLTKKRIDIKQVGKMEKLENKMDKYYKIIDLCESKISMNDPQALQQRIIQLRQQNEQMQNKTVQTETEVNLQITALQQQLMNIDITLIKLSSTHPQPQSQTHQITKLHPINFKKHKKKQQVQTKDVSNSRIEPHTPIQSSRPQKRIYRLQTHAGEKKDCPARYYYNAAQGRNRSVYLKEGL